MTHTLARLALLLIAAPGVFACGGPVAATPTDPVVVSLDRSETAVERALDAAREEADDQEVIAFRARYNPSPACDCPDWEIELRGRWTRVYFETAEDALLDVETLEERARADLEAGNPGVWDARGRIADDGQRDEVSGLEYPVLALIAVESSE